jgi:hypothetical protein
VSVQTDQDAPFLRRHAPDALTGRVIRTASDLINGLLSRRCLMRHTARL